MSQQTSASGYRYDFTTASVELTSYATAGIGPFDYIFPKGVVQDISADASQDSGWVQGNQKMPVGVTPGMSTSTGNFSCLVAEFDDMAAKITGNGSVPLMDVFFDIRVAYSINGIDVRIDRYRGCKINKVSSPNTKGSDPTVVSCELMVKQVIKNGVAMTADPST